MLIIWGLRVDSGRFQSARLAPGGGGMVEDEGDELAVVRYVQSVPKFDFAAPVLRWVHVHPFHAVEEFGAWQPQYQRQGTSTNLGWLSSLLDSKQRQAVCEAVYWAFYDSLVRQCGSSPFTWPIRVDSQPAPTTEAPTPGTDEVPAYSGDAAALAASVSAEIDAKHAGELTTH